MTGLVSQVDQNMVNRVSQGILQTAVAAAIGYGVVRWFTTENPFYGALGGAIVHLVSYVTDPLFKDIFERTGANGASKFIGSTLRFIVPYVVAAGVMSAVGFPISPWVLAAANIYAILTLIGLIGLTLVASAALNYR